MASPASCALFVFCLVIFSLPTLATTAEEVEEILKLKTAPVGVVFEIAENDFGFLELAIPEVSKFAKKLKKRFPKIGIAVVSHGDEIFALKTSEKKKNKALHKDVKSLVNDQKIPVHVCGTYASWYQTSEEEFPAYVDVAPAAPAQIHDYEAIGYLRIHVEID